MTTIAEAAKDFLDCRKIAVTGVSREPKTHGGNIVYTRLKERGYEVFAVNPNTDRVEGDVAYPDLRSVPGGVEGVVIATRPERAAATVREAADLGITRVWMHRSFGGGSVSDEATRYRPRARDDGDRRRLSPDVRADVGRRPQGHVRGAQAHRRGAADRLTGTARTTPSLAVALTGRG